MEESRILSIDYGKKRIGIAITDPLQIFAYPLKTIQNNRSKWDELGKIFKEYIIEKVILGYPLKEDGTKSESTLLVEGFKEEFEKKYSFSLELVDERYSSEIARQKILESVTSRKKRRDKSLVDMNAASIILEDYLKER
jgi:putative Holliday junction resolvase